MKCDICDQEFANSEEVQAHKEREHPMGMQQGEDVENPDLMDKDSESEPVVVRPRR
jgi:hypothetical protein